jgi:hypothetical protein
MHRHRGVCATDFVVCVRAVFACVRVCPRACVFVRARCARGSVRPSVCACARVCARVLRARLFVCAAWSVCAFAGVRVAVLLRGALRMHSWYLRDTRRVLGGPSRALEGYSRVLEAYSRRTHACVERSSSGSHRLMGCTLGYLGGTPRMCVRACDAVHLLGCMTHHKRGRATLHGSSRRTGSAGLVLDAYSHRLSLLCGPSLRLRLRSDALADALADAQCVLPLAPSSAHCNTIECTLY